MKLNLNSNLLNAYKTSNKNPNYSLSFLLSSLDLNSCNLAIAAFLNRGNGCYDTHDRKAVCWFNQL